MTHTKYISFVVMIALFVGVFASAESGVGTSLVIDDTDTVTDEATITNTTTDRSGDGTTDRPALKHKKRIHDALKRIDRDSSIDALRAARDAFEENQGNLENRRTALLRVIDSLIKHAELLRQRIERFPVIEENLEGRIIAEIDADSAKLNELRRQAVDAETAGDLKDIAQTLREHRADITHNTVRKLMILAYIGRFEHRALVKTEERSERITGFIESLAAEGHDVAELERLLAEADELIAKAVATLRQLKADVETSGITDIKFREIKSTLKSVGRMIHDVYDLFRQIVRMGHSLQ